MADLRTVATRTLGTVAATGIGCVAYGAAIERRWYRLRELAVPGVASERLPRPLRLLHISDLHFDPRQDHKVDFVTGLTSTHPDLVVVTGDLLGAVGSEDATVEMLAALTADGTPGLVVLGSNDIYGPTPKSPHRYFFDPESRLHGERLDTRRLVDGLERSGYRVVRNATCEAKTELGAVAVGGIDDPHLNTSVLPPAADLRHNVAAPVLELGLVHAPYRKALDLLADGGYRLLLSGHTHGGQVRFPPIGALVANCDLPLDQVRGASPWGRATLHVSPGLGTSTYAPFRFACRPEATLLAIT